MNLEDVERICRGQLLTFSLLRTR